MPHFHLIYHFLGTSHKCVLKSFLFILLAQVFIFSYRKHSYLQSNAKVSHVEHLIKQPKKSSCCYMCQHCLVHLGDIARYKFRGKQAEIFYR